MDRSFGEANCIFTSVNANPETFDIRIYQSCVTTQYLVD